MIVESPRRRRAGLGKALAIQQQPPLPGLIARLAPSSSSSAAAAAAAAATAAAAAGEVHLLLTYQLWP